MTSKLHGDTSVSVVVHGEPSDALTRSLAAQKQPPLEVLTGTDVERNIASSHGQVIALAEPADVWLPQKILRTSRAFDAEPDLGITVSDGWIDGSSDLHLWDALVFTPPRRRAAIVIGAGNVPKNHNLVKRFPVGRLIPLLVSAHLAPGARVSFSRQLREFVLPVPPGLPVEEWVALAGSLLHHFRLFTEPHFRAPAPDVPWLLHELPPAGLGRADRWKLRAKRLREAMDPHVVSRARARRRVEADLYDALAARFEERGPAYLAAHALEPSEAAAAALGDLRAQAAHQRARGTLPDARVRRIAPVARELMSGAYRRYSEAHSLSALRDLAV